MELSGLDRCRPLFEGSKIRIEFRNEKRPLIGVLKKTAYPDEEGVLCEIVVEGGSVVMIFVPKPFVVSREQGILILREVGKS